MSTELERFDEPTLPSESHVYHHRRRNTIIVVAACGLVQLPVWGRKAIVLRYVSLSALH